MSNEYQRRSATGAEEIVRFLTDHGYRHMFGLPGSQLASVFYEMQKAKITHVPTVHESITISAADGYARVAGSAVAMIYMLPGTANGLANLYNAARDETPLIVIASQQLSTVRTELGAFCEGDTVPLVRPFTRLAHELTKGTPVRSWLEKAKRAAAGPPGGPAYLSITEDVFLEAGPVVDERLSSHGEPSIPDVAPVAAALRRAQRPLIVVGGQLRRCGGAEHVEKLAERFEIPVAFEGGLIDRLGIAPGHSHCIGSVFLSEHQADADVVLMLGTRYLSEGKPREAPYFPAANFVAQVNRDPAKLEGTHRVDWVSASDPAAFAAALLKALEGEPLSPAAVEARKVWVNRRPKGGLPPGPLAKQMGAYARGVAPLYDAMDRGWLVDESVMASALLIGCSKSKDGTRYAGTSGASLGWGSGAATGIAVASGKPVTFVVGDGSLRFGMHGLWTIKAMNLPITIVVLDNYGYGSTRNYEREYLETLGEGADPKHAGYINMDMRTLGPDIADMIRGFGIPCRRLSEQDDLRGAVEEAWATSKNGPNALIMPLGFED